MVFFIVSCLNIAQTKYGSDISKLYSFYEGLYSERIENNM